MSLTGQTIKQRKDAGIVATTATDTALLVTQEQDGSVAKPIELKNLVTDRKDTILGQALPETLSGITLAHNPLRSKPVVANDGNTKAYTGIPVLPSNTAVGANVRASIPSMGYNIGLNSCTIMLSYKNMVSSPTTGRIMTGFGLNFGIGYQPTYGGLRVYFNGSSPSGTLSVLISDYDFVLLVLDRQNSSLTLYGDNTVIWQQVNSNYSSSGVELTTSEDNFSICNSAADSPAQYHTVRLFNYALTPAEVSLLWNNGRPDRAVLPDYMKWGSNENIGTNVNPSFETDAPATSPATGWGNAGNHTGTVISDATAPEGNNVYEIVASGGYSAGGNYIRIGALSSYEVFTVGSRYRLSMYAKSISGNTTIKNAQLQIPDITISSEWEKYSYEFTANSFAFRFGLADAGTFRIDNVIIERLGSVASYTAKGLITDASGKCTSWETDQKVEGTDDTLTATISGSPDLQLIQAEETEGQGLVDSIYKTITTAPMSADGLIGTVPMGWAIDEVLIEKTAGSTSNSLVVRANSTSGTQIGTCSVVAFADSDDDLYTATMTKKRLSNTANKDVYVSGISAGTYIATLRIKKV